MKVPASTRVFFIGTFKHMTIKTKWLVYSVSGLGLIGAGVSLVGEAVVRKAAEDPWFLLGTIGLVILNAGVSVFGQAVVYSMRMGNVDRP